MTENFAEPLANKSLGNATQEVIQPAITGAEIARMGQQIPDALKQLAAGVSSLGNIGTDLAGLASKGSGGGGDGGAAATAAGVASVTRDQNGQIQVLPSNDTLFGSGGKNYAAAAQAGAVSKANQFTTEDLTKLQVSNAGNPEGFRNAAAGYIQGLTPGLGSGVTGSTIINDATQRASQAYNGMVVTKGAQDVQEGKAGLLKGIEQNHQDAVALAVGGQEGSPEFAKSQADMAGKYAQLTSNPAFGYGADVAAIDQHAKGLDIQGARVEGQMNTAYASGGLNGAQDVVSTIDKMPLSDADKSSIKLYANKVLTGLGSGNDAAKTANSGALDSMLAVSGKPGPDGQPMLPSVSDLTDIRNRAIHLGDTTTAYRAGQELTGGHYQRATQGMSPSQIDAAHGIGQPAAPSAFAGQPGVAGDLSSQSTYANKGQPITPTGFVVHHTGGGGTPEGVINTLNERGLGVQYVMDRDGKIYSALPEGTRGAHIQNSNNGSGLSNQNTLGMEIIAKDAGDVTPQQKAAAAAFITAKAAQYGFPVSNVFGHGEVNQGHKEPGEGLAVAQMVRGGLSGAGGFPAGATPLAGRGPPGNPATLMQIRAGATAAGIDPNIMEGIYHGESGQSGRYDIGDNGSSFGPFQLHMGGLAPGVNSHPGMGDDFKKETGLDPRNPSTVPQQIAWVAQKLKADPSLISNFHGYHGPADVGGGGMTPTGQASGQPGQGITWQMLRDNPTLGPAYAKTLAADQKNRTDLGETLIDSATKGMQNNELPSQQVMTQIEQLSANNPGLDKKYQEYSESVAASSLASQAGGGGGQPLIDSARASAAASPDMMYQHIVDRAQKMRDESERQLTDHPVAAAITNGWTRGVPVPIDPANPSSIGAHIAGNAQVVDAITAREPNYSKSVVFADDKPAFKAALNASAQSAATTLQAIAQLPPDKRDATLADPDVSGAIVGLTRTGDSAKMSVAYGFLGARMQENPMAFKGTYGNEVLKDMTAWKENLSYMDQKTLAKTMADAADPSRVNLEEPLRTQAGKNTKDVTAQNVASGMVSTLTQWKGAFSNDAYTPSGIDPAQARQALLSDWKTNYADSFVKYGDDKSARTYADTQTAIKWGTSDSNGGRVMAWPPERSPALKPVNGSMDWVQKQASSAVIEGIANYTTDPAARTAMIASPYALAPDARTESEMTSGKPPSYPIVVKSADGRMVLLPRRFQTDPVQAKADSDAANTATNRTLGRRAQITPGGEAPGWYHATEGQPVERPPDSRLGRESQYASMGQGVAKQAQPLGGFEANFGPGGADTNPADRPPWQPGWEGEDWDGGEKQPWNDAPKPRKA